MSQRRDSTLEPRKRVSLFLRRKRSAQIDADGGMGGAGEFRRAQSHLVKNVGEGEGGEGGRYVEYAGEMDEDSFERLRVAARERRGGMRLVEGEEEDEIIGEICLEDFADAESDFDLLDGQSIDVDLEGGYGRMSRRPSLKLDGGKVRWLGEGEFAKVFAEVSLEELFDVEEAVWEEFEVDEGVEKEWFAAGEEHNWRCGLWHADAECVDVRDLAEEFANVVSARQTEATHVST